MTKSTIKKSKEAAIILLKPPYGEFTQCLIKDVITSCKSNNWQVIKVIQAKGFCDASALYKLIRKVRGRINKPVTVILDKEFLNSPLNLLICCCLGSLYEAKLIQLCSYEVEAGKLKLQISGLAESNFLHKAAVYFKEIINVN